MKIQTIVHTFLFALFPVLSLYSHNVGEVSFSEALQPALALLTLTAIILILFRLIFGNMRKAAILATVFLILSLSYMHVYQSTDWAVAGFKIGRHRNLIPAWILLYGCCAFSIWRTQRNLISVTKILNAFALFLVIIPLVIIGSHKFKTKNAKWNPSAMMEIETEEDSLLQSDTLRDIYYIILDRYPNADTLRRVWNFDNTEFLDYASQSRSNYLKTAHSLASSLNFQFINFLGDQLGEESNNWLPLFQMLQDYKAQHLLRRKGYKYLHFGSWWVPTSKNKNADINFGYYRFSEFSSKLFKNTIFYPLAVGFGMEDQNETAYNWVLFKFNELGKIPKIKEPTFTFAHMIIPHPPYLFDRHGNFLSETQIRNKNRRENYIDQLIYTNIMTKKIIDKLLSDSKTQPIIILQSDEGTFPERYVHEGKNFNWKNATVNELREKMGILNAYYFPNTAKNILYPSITPVNSFRLVFNLYFDTNFELLPDKSFAFTDHNHLYSFFNVTDKIAADRAYYPYVK